MTDVKDNSSLPLLLTITGAVVAVVLGGWIFLGQEPDDTGTLPETAAVREDPPTAVVDETTIESQPVELTSSVEAELRKARLAADAEILVLPETQSAVYYYGRVLQADPAHAVAAAELDAVLTRVAQDVSAMLDDEDYAQAFEIATLVAMHAPEHELVIGTQAALDTHKETLVENAIGRARDGDDNAANNFLAQVESLPDRNPEYLVAIRESLDEIREVRLAAERDRAQRAQLADTEARAAWLERTRSAIEAGNLIAPAGASAYDLLSEENDWQVERDELTAELVGALVAAFESNIGAGQLEGAESHLDAAAELAPDDERMAARRLRLDDAFVDAKSNSLVSTLDLTYVTTAAPDYPKRAVDRELSGYVIVEFTVSPDGETRDIVVTEADPKRVFDKAAVEAVDQWVFEPVVYRGQVISQRAGARLVFNIQ